MVKCPACGSESASPLFAVTAEESAQHFIPGQESTSRFELLRSHIADLWRARTCVIERCNSCQFGFAWPFVAGDSEFYNLAYPHVDYPRSRWEFAKTLSVLDTLQIGGKSGLEIGSGDGQFLDLICRKHFGPARIVAVEFSNEAADRLVRKGYRVFQQDIRDQEFLKFERSFDYVFMFQILEHMDRLDALFERLRFVTRSDASVFIAVPNPRRVEFNETHASLLDMPPNHIGRWSRAAFDAFASRFSFEVVACDVEPFSLTGFIKQDLVYGHLRRAQRHGSLANRVRSWPRTKVRRAAEAGLALLWAPVRLPVWTEAWSDRDRLGGSIWMHMRRH